MILLTESSTVEVDVGILCSCMPCFPSIFKKTHILQSLLAPFKSLSSHLSKRRSSTDTNTQKEARSPGSDGWDPSQYSYPSKDCIEYGEPQTFGKSAVKIAYMAKPAAAVRSGTLACEFGHPIVYEKSKRDGGVEKPVRQDKGRIGN